MAHDNQALRSTREDILAVKKELLDKVGSLSEDDCMDILSILESRGIL